MPPLRASKLERSLLLSGRANICGCDEAGRGALAGPVVAAAVVLDYSDLPRGLADSKTLGADQREAAYELIVSRARCYAIAIFDAREIERLNILHASLQAMVSAVAQLSLAPDYVLVDGPHLPGRLYAPGECSDHSFAALPPAAQPPAQAIVDGDASIACIAAAGILAKVSRDRLMREQDGTYPHYGFGQHFGYPTPQHLAALNAHGPCELHRRSFRPVQDVLQGALFQA